ncbi:MAG: hypothetical protein LBO62_03790 [Endomicrobium sp.]|jgi:hypothetical protein|nr:hypothetical protein [Endomicrobium sp.]
MRQISPAIKSLLKHNNISELRHKLLLYRRKWIEPIFKDASAVSVGDDLNGVRLIITGLPVTSSAGFPARLIDFADGSYVSLSSVGNKLVEISFTDAKDSQNDQVVGGDAGGSYIIFPLRQMLITNINHFPFDNYMLIYHSTLNAKYIIETTPIDITDAINHKGTNVSIAQQLDNDEANVWKVGHLALTLYNENNRFWQDKADGLFPQGYIVYGSKVEYYIGSPTLNDYVKCFTGYLTELPNYRQDEGLVEIRALNRLDWLKTISAENVSTKIKNEQLIEQDTTHCITANAAVGRVQRVLKGTSLSSSVELTEKTDYTVSQLNDYNNGAIIELKSALLSNENIWADYLYWKKGIMIDELVNELLNVAGVDSAHRIVEPVIFQNTSRIAKETLISNAWAWLYQTTADSFAGYSEGNADNNASCSYSGGAAANAAWGCNISKGTIRVRVANLSHSGADIQRIYLTITGSSGIQVAFRLGGQGADRNNVATSSDGGSSWSPKGAFSNGDYFYFVITPNSVSLYKNSVVLISYFINNFIATKFMVVYATSNTITTCDNIAAKMSVNISDDEEWRVYQTLYVESQNDAANFLGFDRLNAIISATGVPNPQIQVSYGNNSTNWTPYYQYQLSSPLQLNYNSAKFIITNMASFGNNYNLSAVKLWSFLQQNIPLGVCNLTNMSILDALEELASLAMYEIGFDADDRFFFRKREQTEQYKEITDDEIISMSSVKYDVNRLKTRVVVVYGEYTKVVDSDEMNEAKPTNKDKYGERTHQISGSQLLPADNVDLAYAIAPTVYEELSKLRLTLTIEVVLDLELELGDYARVLHNNNLFSDKSFTDYTKWKETGTYYMKCKVVGIKTDFNKRITTLDLIDYTSPSDIPVEKGKEFAYQPQESFDVKK